MEYSREGVQEGGGIRRREYKREGDSREGDQERARDQYASVLDRRGVSTMQPLPIFHSQRGAATVRSEPGLIS